MAMNLRLSPEAEEAVRREAKRSGRSQQEVIRTAVSRQLGLVARQGTSDELSVLVAAGAIRPPRIPYRRVTMRLNLPPGVTSADLLSRDDRL